MQVGLKYAAVDLVHSVQHVVMIVPENAYIYKTEYITQEYGD